MKIDFKRLGDFDRGILFEMLTDAYSFNHKYEETYSFGWRECDDFFFDNLHIAEKCCFVTTLNDKAIGFICWDPRNIPNCVDIGHNCICSRYKGNGYGKIQLKEAINRIIQSGAKSITVMTNDDLIPAQRNYESAGFTIREVKSEENVVNIYYEYSNCDKAADDVSEITDIEVK